MKTAHVSVRKYLVFTIGTHCALASVAIGAPLLSSTTEVQFAIAGVAVLLINAHAFWAMRGLNGIRS